jgi:hypothetical protein
MASKYHTREKEEKEDFLLGSSRHPDYYYRNSIQRMQDWWAANPIKRKVYRPPLEFFCCFIEQKYRKI